MMKTLGYLVPEFPTQTHAFFWREAMALEGLGCRVVFFSTRLPPADACPHAFAEEARRRTRYLFPPRPGPAARVLLGRPLRALRAAAHVLRLAGTPPAARLRLLALIPSAAGLAAACREQGIGHVHIHSCANSAHLGALSRILGGPTYSLTLHGDLPVYGTDHAAKMAGALLVTAVTRPLADQIRTVVPDREVPVISMGVDVDRFQPLPASGSQARPEGGRLEVVSIARLNRAKGHRFFLQAMAVLAAEGIDIRYRLAGDGPERAAIEAEVARLGLGGRVELLGAIAEDGVRDLLQGADVLALTSSGPGEAAPVAVMEAMACAVPAICSRIGGTADMITDGEDGLLVEQGDVEGIAAAVRRLVREPGLRRQLAAAARQKALARFDYRVKAGELGMAIAAACSALPTGQPGSMPPSHPARLL